MWQSSFSSAKPVALADDQLVVTVPNSVVKERIEARYLPLVREALAVAGAPDLKMVLEVDTLSVPDPVDPLSDLLDPAPGRSIPDSPTDTPTDTASETPADAFVSVSETAGGSLNHRYTFDAFVTGTSNRFAHAAALSVAETPARSYNPLFIYGDAGLGKTHLLQAIAHYAYENYPTHRVRYVSTETFMNQFVDAIRTNTPINFKRRYREIDILLIDDIQFMEGKEGLQEEFFHTFNSLYEANRQVVLSSDRPPDSISTLEDRLRSRFKMGLITDIQPPDVETRLAILRKKAEQEPTPVPDDVLELIATHITNNIRELEGALIRVAAFATLTHEDLSVITAEHVLADILTNSKPTPLTPIMILEATSSMFNFSIDDIRGKSRRRPLVTSRQISMYVFRELTDLSYPAIAREFGGRDHTTVIYAVEKVRALMKERRQIYDQVTELIQSIKGAS